MWKKELESYRTRDPRIIKVYDIIVDEETNKSVGH